MYKVVQNYQISVENKSIEDGIQTYIAQHNVTKLPYLLKKINTNSDKLKYKSLLNQIGILKVLSSPSVIECHKMLKTSNNVYLVYDYCDGSPLSEIAKTLSREAKINVVGQVVDFFRLMANATVVHCNLKPSSIILSTDKKIKVINFIYGINRNKSKSAAVDPRPSPSPYVAPEVIKQGIAHEKSDFYSLGVILSELGLTEKGNHLNVDNNPNMKNLPQLIEQLMSENPNDRPDLEQIEKVFKGETIKSPRKRSADVNDRELALDTSLKKAKSTSSNEERKILSPISANSQNSRVNQKKFVQQVLKRRNLAIFLLEMSENCLKIEEDERRLGMFLSYILMKKSCTIICNLLGYLKGDKNCEKQIDNGILDKSERVSFEKKPDFFKIITTVQKEAGNQKRWLEDIFKNISPELPPKLKQIAGEEEVSDRTLLSYVKQYLNDLLDKKLISEQQDRRIVQNLYLLSEIICHRSFEKLFEEMISEEKRSLNEQHLYIHVREMDNKSLLAEIAGRLRTK